MVISLKKIWSFVKNYWYIPVILIGIIIMLVLTRKRPDSLIEVLKKATESHKKEIEIIKEVHEEQNAKKEKAEKTYHETVKEVEKKYEENKQNLSSKKKKEIKKLIAKNHEDPEELAKELAELTGFDFVGEENDK